MASDRKRAVFVFWPGRSADVPGYRSASFRSALEDAGIDAVMIDVVGDESPAVARNPSAGCREVDLPDIIREAAPRLVQTFGAEAELGPAWSAAAQRGRPLLHFVRSANTSRDGRQGALTQRLSALARAFSPSRHVTGILGSSRTAVCRSIEAGLFPAATFSRVIAPPVQLPADTTPSRAFSGRMIFGVYDPFGTDDDVRFVLQAIASSGQTDLFDIKLALPAHRIPPALPRNATAVSPADPGEFVRSVDALILPYDADHLVAPLVAALQAGKTVIVPDSGVAAELAGLGRAGVLFAAGSAYDLALKINIVAGSGRNLPFAFHGGVEAVRKCAPGEVAKRFAASYRVALTLGAEPDMQPALPAIERTPRCALIVLARSDPRLLQGTLRSIDQLTRSPDYVTVALPGDRNHVFADAVEAPARVPVRTVRCRRDRSALEQGFGSIASEVDIVLFIPEGVILDTDYLDVLADKVSRWDDLVGEIDIVSDTIKLPVNAPVPDIADLRRSTEWAALPVLRQYLRARSAMASMLWLRVAACGNTKFVPLPESCSFIAFALFLDRMRSRGRTRLLFGRHARQIRLIPEQRTGFDLGYAIFSKLGHVAAYDDRRRLEPGHQSHLRETLEMSRLLGEQALQLVMSPRSKRHVASFLRGMWAARRATRIERRSIRREIRELG